MMFGPNAGAPWANLTTVFETQAVYVTKMIRHIKKETMKADSPYSIMVEAGVQKRFNEWIQSNMGALAIVSPNCSNYYTVCATMTYILSDRARRAVLPSFGLSKDFTIGGA
jgi:hypothetical protein